MVKGRLGNGEESGGRRLGFGEEEGFQNKGQVPLFIKVTRGGRKGVLGAPLRPDSFEKNEISSFSPAAQGPVPWMLEWVTKGSDYTRTHRSACE